MKRSIPLPLPLVACLLLAFASCKRPVEPTATPAPPPVPSLEQTLGQIVTDGEALQEIPFSTVVRGTTGRELLPITPDDAIATRLVEEIGRAVGTAVEKMNRDDSPVRQLRRINEASRFFEDEILIQLNSSAELSCEIPPTAAGKTQRSGYPDLKITHRESGRVAYLDPKLFETGGQRSTLRTFYYQPKNETNKILDDAHHLLVGIEHDGNDGSWQFIGWHLVDLSEVVIRFKPEFQASNRDLYLESTILDSGKPSP
jgi:hypothetical protein